MASRARLGLGIALSLAGDVASHNSQNAYRLAAPPRVRARQVPGDVVSLPARRAGLEFVEKGLPAPSPSRAEMGMLRPYPVTWLAKLATALAARHPGH